MSHTFPPPAKSKGKQPSKAARQRVADNFDADMLKHLCTTWDFSDYAERVDLPPGVGRGWSSEARERFYWHADNGSNILAVAHLDTVQDDRVCQITETASGLLATSGALDDRLGVYVILDLLPKLGINCDWLLTTDEEIGQSTAGDFETEKPYDWMIQFDRGGTDVVMYEYETNELCELVEASGAKVGNGSFSDICMLDHLGVAGFNWGVGYQDYHSARSHAWLDDTFRMVARFEKFHRANATKHFEHTRGRQWWEYGDDGDEIVAHCGDLVNLDDETTYAELEDGYVICIDCASIDGLLLPD